jgi:K(+)-stimulated pyrophosphate-energized sodium pump
MELSLVLGVSALGLIVAFALAKWVLAQDQGPESMQKISSAIREGAEAFMRRQNGTIVKIAVPLAAAIYILYAFVRQQNEHDPAPRQALALWTTVSFVLGAACSLIAGYVGMWIAIRTNVRTAAAARTTLNGALQTALRGGAVSGLLVVAMSLLGVGGLFLLAHKMGATQHATDIPLLIVGYGFGASLVALFAQVGGGIYTKAADVGADLVGKVEAGIPEDDPRNPAVIADLVGDNVGDCAGRGADLFESTAAENIGAMILAASLSETALNARVAAGTMTIGEMHVIAFGVMMFPLVARALGIVASIIGLFFTKIKESDDPMTGLNRGYYLTSLLAAAGFFVATKWLISPLTENYMTFFWCGVIGIATAQAFVYITQYYTEYKYRPVREIAESSVTGPATNVIAGVAVGLESTVFPVITVSIAIIASYMLGDHAMPGMGGLFGTAVATMGMLGTAAYILAMDTFGPITDNAGGIVEMSEQPEEIRKRTDRLDAVGNTTKALTKGYAVGSAALAAFLLFSAYLDEVKHYKADYSGGVNLANPHVFVGALLGATLVFLFSSMTIRAVGKAANAVIVAVRTQFAPFKKGNDLVLPKDFRPDYRKVVDIVTSGALKQMVMPGIIVVAAPILTGIIFKYLGKHIADGLPLGVEQTFYQTLGAEVVAGFLMVGTIAGILMAMFLNNAGGAWDNAKKYIETGAFGGKRSDPHKAAVVGDTVGDPFKDTAGPSLHVLIKLLSTITLVLAPLFL